MNTLIVIRAREWLTHIGCFPKKEESRGKIIKTIQIQIHHIRTDTKQNDKVDDGFADGDNPDYLKDMPNYNKTEEVFNISQQSYLVILNFSECLISTNYDILCF